MKTASAAVLAILANANNSAIKRADLYTFTLKNGTVLRFTDADIPLVVGGFTFNNSLVIKRSQTKQGIGVSVDSVSITIATSLPVGGGLRELETGDLLQLESLTGFRALEASGGMSILGKPLIHQFRNGLFDGAQVLLQKLFLADWNDTSPGPVNWFEGRVADVSCGQIAVQITIKSMLELLNTQMPATLFQPSCNNTLFDTMCALSAPTYTFAGTATSVVSRTEFTMSGFAQADGYFALGKVKINDGANAGQSRTIKSYIGGVVKLFGPFPYDVEANASISASAGCDKTKAVCTTKFANLARNKSFPYIPVPETALEGGSAPGTTGSSGGTGVGTVGSDASARRAVGTYVQ